MKSVMTHFSFLFCCLAVTIANAEVPSTQTVLPSPAAPQATAPVPAANPLVWDAMSKDYSPKPGETSHQFTFSVTNSGKTAVTISQVVPSCGCTVAQLPSKPGQPWILAPGTGGDIQATVNFAGKSGQLKKMLTVMSSAGQQTLGLNLDIKPDPSAEARQRNMMMAMNDRQSVFKNDCATCHATPTVGKTGEELYTKACGICHDAEHRAQMVTDLKSIAHPTDAAFWKKMISEGKPNSLMPGFAKSQGGPLTDEQIDSLVEFAVKKFPSVAINPKKSFPAPL